MIQGIDYDSHAIYVATLWMQEELDPHTARFHELVFRKRHGREAGADFAFPTVLRIPELLSHRIAVPAVVFLERGTGMSRKGDFVLGRVQGAIAATYAGWKGHAPAVNEMLASEWKKALTGNGNASKHDAHAALAGRFRGEMPTDENMRDALAIAYVGRALNRTASGMLL